jgi:hypothetical protein
LVEAVRQALDAFAAGLVVPAQTAVAAVLSDVIGRYYGLTFAVAAREMDEDPGEMPMPYFRFWLVMSLVPRALSQFYCDRGDEVPDTFNRHASAHTVDPGQHTELNALVGLMLAVGLVKEIATDMTEAAADAP